MADIVQRLENPPFGTETSERNLMQAAADEIKRLRAEKKPTYAHMCRDGHVEVGHNDSGHEQCPLCRAQATLMAIADKDGDDLSGNDAEHMVWKAKAALSTIA